VLFTTFRAFMSRSRRMFGMASKGGEARAGGVGGGDRVGEAGIGVRTRSLLSLRLLVSLRSGLHLHLGSSLISRLPGHALSNHSAHAFLRLLSSSPTRRQYMPPRTIRFSPAQRRHAVSSLFALTALGAVVTVTAAQLLPCPVRKHRVRFADDGSSPDAPPTMSGPPIVERRPRRWIEEKSHVA
jgi:cytochrome c oxidase assembly factor 2